MTQTNRLKIGCFCIWNIRISVIVFPLKRDALDFEFLTEKTGFSFKHYSGAYNHTLHCKGKTPTI